MQETVHIGKWYLPDAWNGEFEHITGWDCSLFRGTFEGIVLLQQKPDIECAKNLWKKHVRAANEDSICIDYLEKAVARAPKIPPIKTMPLFGTFCFSVAIRNPVATPELPSLMVELRALPRTGTLIAAVHIAPQIPGKPSTAFVIEGGSQPLSCQMCNSSC